jgi:1,2-dihydroxy-3-keto-5-methylthiopentene dioxygenase
MTILHLRDEHREISDPHAIAAQLRAYGIQYERWSADRPLAPDASPDEVLAAYAAPVATLKAQGGYVTADVIDLHPHTPNLDATLGKFDREHWHDEDEVRFVVAGRGVFYLHPPGGPVVALEVVTGDLIRVPRGTHHWFELCSERRIRAIRLFQDPSGWTPHYTETGVERGYPALGLEAHGA